MGFEVRMGLLRDRIRESGVDRPIRVERHGWHSVPIGSSPEDAMVHYDGWRDRIEIRHPDGSVLVRFGWVRGRFAWDGRAYEVHTTPGGRVEIGSSEGPALRARHTLWGLRTEHVAPAVERIARPLLFGLALRHQAVAAPHQVAGQVAPIGAV